MKIRQSIRYSKYTWQHDPNGHLVRPLVLAFGDRILLEQEGIYDEIKEKYPDGDIVFGSTSGAILGNDIYDNAILITAIMFERARFLVHSENIDDHISIESLGKSLSKRFEKKGLKHLMIISDGHLINGNELIKGLEMDSDTETSITGGLCGDGARFKKTLASHNSDPKQGEVVAIGFYGESFEITSGYGGGWIPFGPMRSVTKAKGNVLQEIDGLPALTLYKKYLGDKASDLPEAALLFPLKLTEGLPNEKQPLVRTILDIDETNNTMVLAGDIAEGARVQLMMSTTDDMIHGAQKAAENALNSRRSPAEFALVISCVGRKLVLDQRTEEEIEEVIAKIGNQALISGFYSYGELAPLQNETCCQLHNQTMTLTLLSE